MSQRQADGGKIARAAAAAAVLALIIVEKVGSRIVGHAFGLLGILVIVLIGVGVYYLLFKKQQPAAPSAPHQPDQWDQTVPINQPRPTPDQLAYSEYQEPHRRPTSYQR